VEVTELEEDWRKFLTIENFVFTAEVIGAGSSALMKRKEQ